MVVGVIESITVTTELTTETLPFTSVTVSVMLFVPTSVQSKVESERTRVAMLQLSEEAESI